CDDKSNWTTSRLRGEVPVTLDHFQYDTQRKLAQHLRQIPALQSQDFSDRRILLQHIAYWFTNLSAKYIHTWQEPVQDMIVAMRSNLHLVTEHKRIALQDEHHPLRRHPMVKFDQFSVDDPSEPGMRKQQYIPYLPAKFPDTLVTAYIVGPRPKDDGSMAHTMRVLKEVSPFLMELDDRQLDIRLPELRTELRRILQGKLLFTDALRREIISAIAADWDRVYIAGAEMEQFDVISEEVRKETDIADIFSQSPTEQLRVCFSHPFAGNLTATQRERLRRRRPVLEYLIREAMESNDNMLLNTLYETVREFMTKLHLVFGDVGHLGLLAYAATCPEPEKFRRVLG
ncbi:MAG: hypothetical protein V1876_03730, partial [Candidatus Peregrinibacteria bacterium]